ncbi:MAG: 30S ribosomal protein S20 [Candidatus Andersenbacteria bacterium]
MPQIKAAEKALRVAARRRVINDRWRRKLRASLKAVREAITAGEKAPAEKSFLAAQVVLDRAARHNIIYSGTAARKKSRLQRAIAKLS